MEALRLLRQAPVDECHLSHLRVPGACLRGLMELEVDVSRPGYMEVAAAVLGRGVVSVQVAAEQVVTQSLHLKVTVSADHRSRGPPFCGVRCRKAEETEANQATHLLPGMGRWAVELHRRGSSRGRASKAL